MLKIHAAAKQNNNKSNLICSEMKKKNFRKTSIGSLLHFPIGEEEIEGKQKKKGHATNELNKKP